MFHHLFNDFYKKKPQRHHKVVRKPRKKTCAWYLVFFKVVSIITWNISTMCTFVRNRRINLVIFSCTKKRIYERLSIGWNRWRGDNVTTEMKQIGGVIVRAQLDFQLKFMYFACGEIHVVFPLFHMPNINSFSVASEESYCWISWHSKAHGTANEPRKKFQSVRLLEPKQQ